MALPLHDRAIEGQSPALVRLTENGLVFDRVAPADSSLAEVKTSLIPARKPGPGEQYRFHFDMTKCIGCRSCEVACNEQNGNPAEINWRRIGELEGGSWPETQRHYLSMGCNHCLSADCLRGCPVDAYTKDPLTGIVLHSADACIGCQYCVWNCPYSVPQFNPERGVVGKCDMCKGRLDEGLEPACVDSCPEAAIEIEIVNIAAWSANYALADSPGMPAAEQTLSTTRITLPIGNGSAPAVVLERVDAGQVQPEHAHMSLVYMTTLMQAVAGTLVVLTLTGGIDALRLVLLFSLTAGALQGSTMHLGRPAFAYRALKMWRRSWLSREVLLFTLFFLALTAATAATVAGALGHSLPTLLVHGLTWSASLLGIAGTVASAFIYLVQARPSWNLKHTPVDFLVTASLLGGLLSATFTWFAGAFTLRAPLYETPFASSPILLAIVACSAAAWIANQGIRVLRLRTSPVFERRASFGLLASTRFHLHAWASLLLVALAPLFLIAHLPLAATASGFLGVLLARYLFFVSVVPLNMALTFVRSRHA